MKKSKSQIAVGDPSAIPAFDRTMRGLIQVPKSEVPTHKPKKPKPKK